MEQKSLIRESRFPKINLNKTQKRVVFEINDAIRSEIFHLVQNHCMCRNNHEEKDVIISIADIWGISIGQVLCSKCGLIRNRYVFSSESNTLFYEKYYRRLYNVNNCVDPVYYLGQNNRGKVFVELLKRISVWDDIYDVAELGCGAGGVLLPFAKEGKNVVGVDLNGDFLELGIKSGLNLKSGCFYNEIEDNSCDLIILSHVLEHFNSPIKELNLIFPKIKKNKYLLVQVPGLFSNPKPHYPLSGFQVAHVYYFYKEWLFVLFKLVGLDILYCDDSCTFVCKKTNDVNIVDYVWDDCLMDFPNIVKKRCKSAQLSSDTIYNKIKTELCNIVKLGVK